MSCLKTFFHLFRHVSKNVNTKLSKTEMIMIFLIKSNLVSNKEYSNCLIS